MTINLPGSGILNLHDHVLPMLSDIGVFNVTSGSFGGLKMLSHCHFHISLCMFNILASVHVLPTIYTMEPL